MPRNERVSVPEVTGYSHEEVLSAFTMALGMMDGLQILIETIKKQGSPMPTTHRVRQLAMALLILGHDKCGEYGPDESLADHIMELVARATPMMDFMAHTILDAEKATGRRIFMNHSKEVM